MVFEVRATSCSIRLHIFLGSEDKTQVALRHDNLVSLNALPLLLFISLLVVVVVVVVIALRQVNDVVLLDDIALCKLKFFSLTVGRPTRDLLFVVIAHHIELLEYAHVVASVGH